MRNTRTTAAAELISKQMLKRFVVQIVRSCLTYTYPRSDNFMLEWGQWRVQRQEMVSASVSLIIELLRKEKIYVDLDN